MSDAESGSAYTMRMTPLRNMQSDSSGCLRLEGKWWVGGPLPFGIYDVNSMQNNGGELKGGHMRTTDLDRTGIYAAGFDRVGGPGREGLAESRQLFGSESGPAKRLPQDPILRMVVV